MLAQDFKTISFINAVAPVSHSVAAMIVPAIIIDDERSNEVPQREALLDAVMGPQRKRKSSEKIRKNRLPADGLNLVARDENGTVIGSVRLWHIRVANKNGGFRPALLLGPLAVSPYFSGKGIGSRLMVEAISRAKALGHGAILLVGDADYYCRFGFCASKAADLAMPGPFERSRFQGLELIEGWLQNTHGVIIAAGKKSERIVRASKKVA